MNKLSAWLNTQLNERGWSQRELSRRSGFSPTQISDVINGKAPPSADFCLAIARALGHTPENILRLAGLLPPLPPAVTEERETLHILRRLSTHARQSAVAMLRGLAGNTPPAPAHSIGERRTPYLVDHPDHPNEFHQNIIRTVSEALDQLNATPETKKQTLDIITRALDEAMRSSREET